MFELGELILVLVVITHFMSCMWSFVGLYEISQSIQNNWIEKFVGGDNYQDQF